MQLLAIIPLIFFFSFSLIAQTNALHYAVEQGDIKLIRERIVAGDSINERDVVYGKTPLHLAVERNFIEVATYLIAAGASPNIASFDPVNPYPLHLAVAAGCAELITILVESGADLEHISPLQSKTALHRAVELGRILIVERLLVLGANPHARDKYGCTPLDIAHKKKWHHIIQLLENYIASYSELLSQERK